MVVLQHLLQGEHNRDKSSWQITTQPGSNYKLVKLKVTKVKIKEMNNKIVHLFFIKNNYKVNSGISLIYQTFNQDRV